jgi:uncharacterized protein YgiM (DUF1202 family)
MTVTLGGFVGFVLQSALSDDPVSTTAQTVALGLIGVLFLLGVVLWLLERRAQESVASMYSRGIFSVGTGFILLIAFLFVPQIPTTILPIPTSTPIAAAVNNPDNSSNIVPTSVAVDITATPQLTATPTLTRTPLPSPSPTRTRRAYVPPTPTVTPEGLAVLDNCGATVSTNLNVRAEDSTDSDVVSIVPEGQYVNLIAKNPDSTWWQTDYEGIEGWLFADLLTLDPACLVEVE